MRNRTAKIDFQKVDTIVSSKFWTWAELGRRAEISSATVLAIKAGRRNASYKTIRKIAAALEVQPRDIVQE